MSAEAEPQVLTEERDGVLVVTINRPGARNAINQAVSEGMAAAFDVLDARPDLKLGIVTGAGGTFSAGMDLKAFLAGENVNVPGRGLGGLCQRAPRKPLIAAVEGWALAGGFEVALACDMIVAGEEARFGIPEVKRGLIAGAGGLLRLPRRIPPAIAMQLALTGDPITAPEAHRLGLVNVVTEEGGALDGALRLAATIAANAPLAVAASKQIIVESVDWSSEDAWVKQAEIMRPVFASEDAREGPRAFAEKRPPVWQSR